MKSPRISRLTFGVLVVFICPLSGANEDLWGWEESRLASGDSVFSDYADYLRTELYIALKMSTFSTWDVRLGSAEQRLSHIHGDIPQRIRLLLWLVETEPVVRQAYLLQWLSEKESIPARSWTEKMLRQLLTGRRQESIEQRIAELDSVYKELPVRHEEVHSNTEALKHRVDKLYQPDDRWLTSDILDKMTEDALFDVDSTLRKKIYHEVYPPMRKRNGPNEIVDDGHLQILIALSSRESETTILQHLNTERSDATNIYEVAWGVLDMEARERRGEKTEDSFDAMPPSLLEREYEEAEWKRRRAIGILEGVTIPRVHTENCCGLCDTSNVPKRLGNADSQNVMDYVMGDVFISEIVTNNIAGLKDEDGTVSNWIELHNRGTKAVSLLNWKLLYNDTVWTFPDVKIASQQYMVIFASGKNRLTGQLHTNFTMSNGEDDYLALAKGMNDDDVVSRHYPLPVNNPDTSYEYFSAGVGDGMFAYAFYGFTSFQSPNAAHVPPD